MQIRGREDFIENIQAAHTHLLILTEDIKYPLTPLLQRCLESALTAVGYIVQEMMKEDIAAVIRAIGEQQQDEAGEGEER